MVRLVVLFGICLYSSFPLVVELPAARPKDELHVLFIGNSLTYANDLPAIVAALAAATKRKRLVYKTVALPDFGLEEHWQHGEARRAIAGSKWDIVVLQQGPSAQPESRVVLLDTVRRFDVDIRKAGARTALYMVWPSAARSGDFERVSESYRLAAEAVKGMLLPVGEAWRAAWRKDPQVKLYSPDGFHPSMAGSCLAALVIYEQLFASPPAGRREMKGRFQMSDAQMDVLQQAATEANAKFGKR